MTQVGTQDAQAILRDVLHIIAVTPDPVEAFKAVLDAVRSTFDAEGAAIVLFNEPALVVTSGIDEARLPSVEDLQQVAVQQPVGFHLNPVLPPTVTLDYPNWLIAQLKVQRSLVGVLWLALREPLPEDHPALTAILDALTVIATSTDVRARHDKIIRNQNEFLRIVSHDLRSPLTSMHGFASMLESGTVGEINEKQVYFVEKILSGIAQMASLVENIQDAGRYDPETGFYEMQRAPCDVIDIVNRIVNNHLLPAEKQELTITTDISDDIPIINADGTMLERAITNLVDNAIKYTPNGGEIQVGIRRHGEQVVVSVRDSGLGISPENQKLLFERHVRIPRTEHKKIKGSGLGLFIVRSVAQRHDGQAWVESTEGKGSTFFISIPLDGQNVIVS